MAGDLAKVWSASPTLAWAIAADDKGGVILTWDGTAWTASERFGEVLTDLDGIDANLAWITTTKRVLAWDGKTWATMPGAPTGIRLHRLDARTASDIWMTSASTVWHYDGKVWTSEKVDLAWWSLLVEPDAVWIGAEDGALLRRSR